jgi:hypothetical protein
MIYSVSTHELRSTAGELTLSLHCTCGWNCSAAAPAEAREQLKKHGAAHAQMWEKKRHRVLAKCRSHAMTVESYENACRLRPDTWEELLRPFILRWSRRLDRIQMRLGEAR